MKPTAIVLGLALLSMPVDAQQITVGTAGTMPIVLDSSEIGKIPRHRS